MRNLFTFLACTLLALVGCSSDPELFGATSSVCVTGIGGNGGTGGMGGNAGTGGGVASSSSSSASSSSTASSSSGGQCMGACVQASDCSGIVTECRHPDCVDCQCTVAVTPEGVPTSNNVAGDCLTRQCDGLGNMTFILAPDDFKDDANECTTDYCANAGSPRHDAKPVGTGCKLLNGLNGVCTGLGGSPCSQCPPCVECMPNYLNCPVGKTCVGYTCI